MSTKYTAIYERTVREKRTLDEISKILPKEEKAKGTKFYHYRTHIKAVLREIEAVKRELAC